MKDFLTSTAGSCGNFGFPFGALTMAAAAVSSIYLPEVCKELTLTLPSSSVLLRCFIPVSGHLRSSNLPQRICRTSSQDILKAFSFSLLVVGRYCSLLGRRLAQSPVLNLYPFLRPRWKIVVTFCIFRAVLFHPMVNPRMTLSSNLLVYALHASYISHALCFGLLCRLLCSMITTPPLRLLLSNTRFLIHIF